MAEIRFSSGRIEANLPTRAGYLPNNFHMSLPFNKSFTLPSSPGEWSITENILQNRSVNNYNSHTLYNGEMSSTTTINMSNVTRMGKGSTPLR